MDDLISRQQAIDAAIEAADDWDGGCNIGRQTRIERYIRRLPSVDSELINELDFGINASTGDSPYMVGLRNGLRLAKSYVDGSDPQFEEYAETEVFEWCDTCKEYDQEKHCCHRFSKVIRQAFEEMKVVHCIDCRHSEYDEVYKDRYCHYNGKAEVVDDYHYCRDGERRDDE